MDLAEKNFLERLSELDNSDVKRWIRFHYSANNFYIQSPFDGLNDPMNVLDRTLELINVNRYNNALPIINTFESSLVETFGEDVFHPYIHPGVILKYLSIFINCPPLGEARNQLVTLLINLVSKRTLKGIEVGVRDLHFDSLELLAKLSLTKEKTIIEDKEFNEFLIIGLLNEPDPRFSNVALTYFKNSRSLEYFFKAFQISMDSLSVKYTPVFLDILTSMYWKDRTISWKYFANWATAQIGKNHKNDKFAIVCSNEKLFKLIVQRWEDNIEVNLDSGRTEGQYLIALMVLMKSVSDKKMLSPKIISELFMNEHVNSNKEILSTLYNQLPGASEHLLHDFILKNLQVDLYPVVHIAVIYLLKTSLYNEDDLFELVENDVDIEIDQESIPPLFRIQNLNGELLNSIYNWPEKLEVIVSTPIEEVKESFLWWTNAKLCIANSKVNE